MSEEILLRKGKFRVEWTRSHSTIVVFEKGTYGISGSYSIPSNWVTINTKTPENAVIISKLLARAKTKILESKGEYFK